MILSLISIKELCVDAGFISVKGSNKKKIRIKNSFLDQRIIPAIIREITTESKKYFISYKDDSQVSVTGIYFNKTKDGNGINFGGLYDVPFSSMDKYITPFILDPYLNQIVDEQQTYANNLFWVSPEHYENKRRATEKLANNYDCKGGYTMIYPENFICITEGDSTITFDSVCDKNGKYSCWNARKTFGIKYQDGTPFVIFSNQYKIPKHYVYNKLFLIFISNNIFNVLNWWNLNEL